MTDAVIVSGIYGSPYTRKMLAVLRYRRIPYRFITPAVARERGLPAAKVPLMPTLYLPDPDGRIEAVTDTTPLIRRFETSYEDRCVIHPDPAVAFIDMLIEDYGDEWLTRPLFHYRWVRPADIKRAGDVLPLWFAPTRSDEEIAAEGRAFGERQIGRLYVVGATPQTAPLLEQSYLRFADALSNHLREHTFLMGNRPGASDFAVYGQLTQLAQFDPTPMALTLEQTPRVYAYSTLMEDLSGAEPEETDWVTCDAIPETISAILEEVGRTYAPVMLANARALAAGADRVEATVDGQPWIQKPFPYQGKCLKWLREAYAALDARAMSTVEGILKGTGCEPLLSE